MQARTITRHVPAADGTLLAVHTHLDPSQDAAGEANLKGRPTVLLTNGIGTTSNFWRHLVEVLTPDHRVVHWDYRGHGQSENARSGGYGIATQVDDFLRVTRTVMDAGDQAPPLHVGFSMGVGILLEGYRRFPELFPALVLIAGAADAPGTGTGPFRIPGARLALRRALDAFTPAVPHVAPWVHRFIASPLLYPTGRLTGALQRTAPKEDIAHFMSELCRMDPMAFYETLKGLMAMDASDVLPKVTVPTLVIAPERDNMLPFKQVLRMTRQLPHAEVMRVPNAGHATLLEQGTHVAGAIRAFVDGRRDASRA